MSTPKYKLIYFNCQWIAEPIRYVLSYVREDFEDVRLDWEEWIKPDGKIDKSPYPYEKLPILEDAENGLKLGQSFSIVRYLARKYNLVGKTEAEAAKCDEYADVLKDILLVYFNIRGLAEPIRWMFQIAGVDFIDERINLEDWKEERERFQKQVGQLPILYVDEQIELTQVHSVMRYVARQLGFNGKNEMETARADEVCELVYDLRLCAVAYKDSFTSKTPDIVRHTVFRDFRNEPSIAKKALMRKHLLELHFPKYLSRFAKLLDEGEGDWVAGSTLTYADFVLANFLDVAVDNVNPDVLKDFPSLRDLKDRIFSIPEVQEFIYSTRKSGFYGGVG